MRSCKVLSFLMLSSLSFSAYTQVVYDPWDVIQNTITAKNTIKVLLTQMKQLECELANLKKLSKSRHENNGAWLLQLEQAVSEADSLSYGISHVGDSFNLKFPGLISSQNVFTDFSNWSKTLHNTLHGSLSALELQGKSFSHEQNSIQELEKLSDSASGNLQTQQTAHRILLQQISQLQKLRQVLLNQASSQDAFMAYSLQKDQSQQAIAHQWIQHSQIPFKRYNDKHGFGASNVPQLP